jgi:hypothetical protein
MASTQHPALWLHIVSCKPLWHAAAAVTAAPGKCGVAGCVRNYVYDYIRKMRC